MKKALRLIRSLLNQMNLFFLFCFFSVATVFGETSSDFTMKNPSGIKDFPTFVNRLIEYATALVSVVAVLYLIISGFQYILAGGDQKKAAAARSAIQNTLIGVVVVVIAYVLVKFVLINFLDVKTSFFGDFGTTSSELGL